MGSYKKTENGNTGVAFMALTGGTVNRFKKENTTEDNLFARISDALAAGTVVAFSTPVRQMYILYILQYCVNIATLGLIG